MPLVKIKQILDSAKKKPTEEMLIDIHHEFMKFYKCWIPIEEFKKMKISQMSALLNRIIDDRKKPEVTPVIIVGYAKKSAARKLLR